jgi:hypothetical protein
VTLLFRVTASTSFANPDYRVATVHEGRNAPREIA